MDEAYNRLLASALADNRVYVTNITEATAPEAAMTAKIALAGKSPKDLAGDFEIGYQEAAKNDIPELFSYRDAWIAEVEK